MNVPVLLLPDGSEVPPVGKVFNLRVVEILGSTVTLGWTGVAGATQYRIRTLNTEGQQSRTGSFYCLDEEEEVKKSGLSSFVM